MEDWYSVNIDKIAIKEDYQNNVSYTNDLCNIKQDPVNLYDKFLEMDEKIVNVLNEVRESIEMIEKKMFYIEEKLNIDNLKLKNTLLEKELELERMKNALVRHKISFPFTPHTNHNLSDDINNKKSFSLDFDFLKNNNNKSKTFIEKFLNNL
jgi:hypothetical protein